jgi:hypothetical protein
MLFKEIIAVYSENHTKYSVKRLLRWLGHIISTRVEMVNDLIQTGSGIHQAFYPMSTGGGLFPWR